MLAKLLQQAEVLSILLILLLIRSDFLLFTFSLFRGSTDSVFRVRFKSALVQIQLRPAIISIRLDVEIDVTGSVIVADLLHRLNHLLWSVPREDRIERLRVDLFGNNFLSHFKPQSYRHGAPRRMPQTYSTANQLPQHASSGNLR